MLTHLTAGYLTVEIATVPATVGDGTGHDQVRVTITGPLQLMATRQPTSGKVASPIGYAHQLAAEAGAQHQLAADCPF